MQALLSPSAQCKRDGTWKELEARELVPGDLIQLKGGDVVPADGKVRLLQLGAYVTLTDQECGTSACNRNSHCVRSQLQNLAVCGANLATDRT